MIVVVIFDNLYSASALEEMNEQVSTTTSLLVRKQHQLIV